MASKSERWPLARSEDVVIFRQAVRRVAVDVGLRLIAQTKLATAASELARNAIEHATAGIGLIEVMETSARRGVRVIVSDQGGGIEDIGKAMQDGYTSGRGMGLGLGGAKRLSDAFSIDTRPGQGTTITIELWV